MSKVFIHVGLHKTASTFFQTEIFPYFENTICITRPYTQQSVGFNKLQYADDTVYDPEEFKLEFQQIKGKNIIISDELLSGIPYANCLNRSLIANRLSQLFPEAEIIVFLRGQRDILLSMYNQYVKMGGTETIERYIWYPQKKYTYEMYCSEDKKTWNKNTRYYNHLSKNLHPEHFLYYQLIKMYYDKFPKVHIFLYEDFICNSQEIVNQIQNIIQQPLKKNQNNIALNKKNIKLPDEKIAITRYQNIVKPILNNKNKYILRLGALFYLQFIESKKKKHRLTSDAEYVENLIDNFYTENNRKIIQDYPHIPIQNHPQKYQL
ncbi:MAG: hypothetical protein QNJ32_22490 [Xenococcaceae cyanobacterium MO_167.B27]|nr:hypothetical protein [Xenococcaceae cyanobacterium MO_167.B27]